MTTDGAQEGRRPPGSFVGREQELLELRAALDETPARGRVFLISGEPGIGKTRLADEIAGEARRRGTKVAWGRCWEGGGTPAYWPFIQIVRSCIEAIEPDQRRSILESEIPPHVISEIAQIIPELRPADNKEPPQSPSVDSGNGRFRLFDAVANFLKTLAHRRPLLIVVDDLHEADLASLAMLGFVAREAHDASMLIIGTYRDTEMRRSAERLKLVEEILREGHQLPLAGLAKSEVADMVQARSGKPASEAFVEKLNRLTGGNPLFVDGVVRVLAAEGDLAQLDGRELAGLKLPDSVRGAIAGRLAMLSEEARGALAVAAVVGQEFEQALLARVSGLSADQLAESTDEACEVGILVQAARDRYRFSHPLIREALYRGQKDTTRIATHRGIGEALEEVYATSPTPDASPWPFEKKKLRRQAGLDDSSLGLHLAELAHHFRQAGLAPKAIDYSIKAGKVAYALYAYEEALSHWQTALALMDAQGGGDKKLRARILRQFSDDLIADLVDSRKRIEYLESAAQIFEELGDDEWSAETHSELGIILSRGSAVSDLGRGMYHFRAAEAFLAGQPDSYAKAVFYVTKACSCINTMDTKAGLEAARRAMEIGARPEWETQWFWGAIVSSRFLVDLGRLEEGLELARQARRQNSLLDGLTGSAVARGGGANYFLLGDPCEAERWWEPELLRPRTAHSANQAGLHGWMALSCLDQGDLVRARWHLEEAGGTTGELGADLARGVLKSREGLWEASEELFGCSFDQAKRTADRFGEWSSAWNLAAICRYRGDYGSAEQLAQQALTIAVEGEAVARELPCRAELIFDLEPAGRVENAVPHLDRLREILGGGEDWRGRAGLVACAEGVIAGSEGKYQEAADQFEKAIDIFRRFCLRWDEAEAFYCYGRVLLAARERRRANEKFDAAIEIYRQHGAGQRWIDRVESARETSRLSPIGAGSKAAAGPEEITAMFKREGEFWTLVYRGTTFRLKDLKGLAYIAFLLAHPGERFHVHELIARVEGVDPASPIAPGVTHEVGETHDLGDAGDALDRHAQADYRHRLRELAEELAEAERLNDIGRAERIRSEQDFLSMELHAATGIGGRDRKAVAHVERARSMVRKNIRAGLDRIRDENAALGRYFATSIKTGYYCAYLPDPERKISWQL
jgi:tetratricopeptide (TPR) repeat protein